MSDLITLSCPNCAGKLRVVPESASLVCPSCGSEYLMRYEAAGISLERYARCPRCRRNDQVRIVSAIVRETGPLAQALAPPNEPVLSLPTKPLVPISVNALRVGCLAFIALVILVMSVIPGSNFWMAVGLASLIPIVICAMVARRKAAEARKRENEARAAHAAAYPRWERAMSRWRRLYYCARDDCVFVPGEHLAVPLGQIEDLLYR